MAIDGIRKIKKVVYRSKNKKESGADPSFWGLDIVKPSTGNHQRATNNQQPTTVKRQGQPWNWQHIIKEIKHYFLNKRLAYAIFGMVIVLGVLSVSFSAYSFITRNYDFLKLFKDGKYLILFQNNTELRASGGFIGSFAEIETNNGLLAHTYFDTNIYKRDNAFILTNKIDPPDPALNEIVGKGRWAMRDSNWAIDFPTAAQQVAWFYEQEGGQPVDGVVAINATVMSDILKIVGPIEMPEYNTTVTSENFLSMVQYKIEKEYFQTQENKDENEPKTILKDMIPKLEAKLIEKKNYSKVIDLIRKELKEKQVQFYFYDGDKQKIVAENSWSGEVEQASGDYLNINNSNLTANKSSLNIKEDVKLNTSISDSGNVINTLTITRTHSGNGEWPDGENKNYMRILVPSGTKLISTKLDEVGYLDQINIKKESGKTAFGLWMNIKPRSSRILKIVYELPNQIKKKDYSLLVQKQSGNLGDDLEVVVNGSIKFSGILNSDREIK